MTRLGVAVAALKEPLYSTPPETAALILACTSAGVIAVTVFVPAVDSPLVAIRILPAVVSVASAIEAAPLCGGNTTILITHSL